MLRLTILCCLIVNLAAAQERPYALPKDKDACVLSLDYAGGYTPTRKDFTPFLQIFADGRVRSTDTFTTSSNKVFESKMSMTELQKLLRFVIKEQKFCEWKEKAILKEFEKRRKAGKPVDNIEDAADTVINLRLPKHKMKATMNALGYVYRFVPELRSVQRLKATQDKLHLIAAKLRAGGEKKIKNYLVELNQELQKKFPKERAFTVQDLSHVTHMKNGDVHLTFSRPHSKEKRLYAALVDVNGGKNACRISLNDV